MKHHILSHDVFVFYCAALPTIVDAPRGSVVITPGVTRSFECRVTVDSDINVAYEWTKDGFHHSNGEILTLRTLTQNNNVNGVYACFVRLTAVSISGAEPLIWQVGTVVLTVGGMLVRELDGRSIDIISNHKQMHVHTHMQEGYPL